MTLVPSATPSAKSSPQSIDTRRHGHLRHGGNERLGFPGAAASWGAASARHPLRPNGVLVREEVFDNLSLSEAHERYFVAVINGDPEETDYAKRMRRGLSILARVEDLSAGRGAASPRLDGVDESDEGAALRGGGGDDPSPSTRGYFTGDDGGAYFRPAAPNATRGRVWSESERALRARRSRPWTR